jgi:predicted small lipoprotein YifL
VRNVRAIPLLLVVVCVAGCGKKGAPLPPLLRIPAAVDAAVMRVESDVFVRLTVPTSNVDGYTPADVSRVEVYAITTDRPPTAEDDPEDLRKRSTLVATEQVRRPLPPLPPAEPDDSAPPAPPLGPGVDQGSEVVVRETITPEMREPVTLRQPFERPRREPELEPLLGPLVAPTESGEPTRYYYAVGVSRSGRYGPTGALQPVPLGTTSGAPGRPELTHDATNITVKWTPPADARGVGLAPEPDVLPSKPLFAGPPATTYDVYDVPANESPAMPTPLTPAPVGALELASPIGTFGVERCFFVRSVDIVDGYHVRGPASPTVCVTPTDTFAPDPPKSLAAVATEGAINLIWEPSESADLAGYIVLRSRLPDDTLQPAMEEPMTGTTFVDKGVRPGVTYGYAVIAVDKAGNRSEPSNRVEETARQ